MKEWLAEYRKKLISADEAARKIESGMEVVISATSEPISIMEKFSAVADKVRNVKVFSVFTTKPYDVFINHERKGSFELTCWFWGACARAAQSAKTGSVSYQPNLLHNIAPGYLETRKPNIYIGSCTPPDKHGHVHLALSLVYEKDMVEAADMVILEVTKKAPRVFGDTEVHIDDVDFFVEDDHDLFMLPNRELDEIDLSIGRHIAELVPDEATIQLGIGEIPNAVARCLETKKDLGVHTEMLVDSMRHLYDIGVITNKKKTLYNGKFICAFLWGTQELYDWADNNSTILMLKGRYVNDPAVIRRNSKMRSINTCMMVDLTGQVFSEGIGTNHYSGTGGQLDTALGARQGLDGQGKSIIACRSTAKDGQISTIVSLAPQGTPVTLHRGITDYVVTEYGSAWLRGKTVKERVGSLIGIAHPDFREQLREEAERLGFI
ncbi:MAG: acetyl-CoA hydrolase/transferase C-terminal domain-containing protein [Syntrophorhabdales bacterium]